MGKKKGLGQLLDRLIVKEGPLVAGYDPTALGRSDVTEVWFICRCLQPGHVTKRTCASASYEKEAIRCYFCEGSPSSPNRRYFLIIVTIPQPSLPIRALAVPFPERLVWRIARGSHSDLIEPSFFTIMQRFCCVPRARPSTEARLHYRAAENPCFNSATCLSPPRYQGPPAESPAPGGDSIWHGGSDSDAVPTFPSFQALSLLTPVLTCLMLVCVPMDGRWMAWTDLLG